MRSQRWFFGGPLAPGAAAGLLGVTARAALVRVNGGVGGDLLAELVFIAFLAGLAATPEDRRVDRATSWSAPLFLAASGIILALWGVRPGIGDHLLTVPLLITGLAAFFLHLGLAARLIQDLQGATVLLAGIGGGWLAGAVLLPLAGPFLLFAVVLLLDAPAGPPERGRWYAVVLAVALLGAAAWVDTPGGAARIENEGPSRRLLSRVWYADGPAEARAVRKRAVRVSQGGGATRWSEASDVRRRPAERRAVTAGMVRELAVGGPVLALGPASASALADEAGGPVTALDVDRRWGWWWERYRPGGSNLRQVTGPPRRFLARTMRRFKVVHYVEPTPQEVLAAGAAGRQPAYHLTVEALQAYLRLLEPGGFLVMEVPYSLRVAAMLKELELDDGPRLAESLVVYGAPGGLPDVVVAARTRLGMDALARLDALASARKYQVLYRPGMRQPPNIFVRLARTARPRGYYASGTAEFTPATDDRPFFHQVQKFVPRTRARERVGLEPAQTRRFLGLVPPGDLPWVLLGLACLGTWGAVLARDRLRLRRGAPPPAWRPRTTAALLLLGGAAGMFGEAGWMALGLSSASPVVTGAVVAAALLGGLGAGVQLAGGPGAWRYGAGLLLPLSLLPLVPRLWPAAQRGSAGEAVMTLLLAAPLGIVVGALLGGGMRSGSRGLGPAVCLALAGLGGLAGKEASVPVAQTFGLVFALMTAWVTALVAARTLARVPSAGGS